MLKLTLIDADNPAGSAPAQLTLDKRKIVLGRSPNDRWDLPDPDNKISYAHCQIDYVDGAYVFVDHSTNGTYLNGARDRMEAPRTIAEGDEFSIGRFRLRAEFAKEDVPAAAASGANGLAGGWTAGLGASPAAESQEQDSRLKRYVEANRIDWVTGMSAIDPSPQLQLREDPASSIAAAFGAVTGGRPATPGTAASSDSIWTSLLSGAGLSSADVRVPAQDAAAKIGNLLRRLTAGLMLLLAARARAKDELGAAGTIVSLRDNNPLKFLSSADTALACLVNPPAQGNLDGEQAIENAFKDLQAHQMAILIAIQHALRATLSQFSPDAIASRANVSGLLASISPSMREAACWRVYQKEFEGIATGSDDAFMESFADTFRNAYQKVTSDLRQDRT